MSYFWRAVLLVIAIAQGVACSLLAGHYSEAYREPVFVVTTTMFYVYIRSRASDRDSHPEEGEV